MIKLSIITVNYKAWIPLERCLNSLMSLQTKNFNLEVIIVDNFSNDGRLEEFIEKFPSFNFIKNSGNYGFSNGNNLGAKYATGDFLMFLNSDTIVTREPIESMLNLAQNNKDYSIISSQQMSLDNKPENPYGIFPSFWTINSLIKSIYGLILKSKERVTSENSDVIFPDWVSGSLILISRDQFDNVKGWDEDYWLYFEDTDLCKKVKDNGGKVAMQCKLAIIHQHGGTTRRTLSLTAFYKTMVIISKHIYFRKHYSGMSHFFLQSFIVLNTLLFENLFQAIFGLIFFPFGSFRKYLLIYFNILKYYFRSAIKQSWFIDIRKVKLPE